MQKSALMVLLALMTITGQAATVSASQPPSLDDVLSLAPKVSDGTGVGEIRYNAIRETALTHGVQAGLARRNAEVVKKLEATAASLDVVYNFQPLMLEGNVLPPVMLEANDVYEQKSDLIIRLIGKAYVIDSPAKLVYAPPTWRTYLLHDYSFDKNALLAVSPVSAQEVDLWRDFVTEGFRRGEEQAERIFEENLSRLKRDFEGMVRYRTLLAKGMVTRPFVAASHAAVTGQKNGHMNVAETVLQITATPEFVMDRSQWAAQPTGNLAERLQMASDPVKGRALVEGSGVVRERSRGYAPD